MRGGLRTGTKKVLLARPLRLGKPSPCILYPACLPTLPQFSSPSLSELDLADAFSPLSHSLECKCSELHSRIAVRSISYNRDRAPCQRCAAKQQPATTTGKCEFSLSLNQGRDGNAHDHILAQLHIPPSRAITQLYTYKVNQFSRTTPFSNCSKALQYRGLGPKVGNIAILWVTTGSLVITEYCGQRPAIEGTEIVSPKKRALLIDIRRTTSNPPDHGDSTEELLDERLAGQPCRSQISPRTRAGRQSLIASSIQGKARWCLPSLRVLPATLLVNSAGHSHE